MSTPSVAGDPQACDFARLTQALDADRDRPVGGMAKGFAAAGDRAAAGLAGADAFATLATPFAVIREDALAANIAAMAGYCAEHGVRHAPHAKTTMSPQLFARQLRAGAWGLTAAHIGQVAVYRSYGVRRILLANQLVDPVAIAWLADQMRDDEMFTSYVWVDSVDGVQILEKTLRAHDAGRPVPVLVELGIAGGRTGARTVGQALAVARVAARSGVLRVAGAAGFEGVAGSDAGPVTLQAVQAFCRDLRRLAGAIAEELPGPQRTVVTAGGSSYFDVVTAELTAELAGGPSAAAGDGFTVILRSGSYVTHDHGHIDDLSPYHRGTGPTFRPALEIWTHILSRPEPGLALACAGKRDLAYDLDLPVVTATRRAGRDRVEPARGIVVTALNDQHAFLRVPEDLDLAPGDLVCLGISHPCTAFDKWRALALVDDEYRIRDVAQTYF